MSNRSTRDRLARSTVEPKTLDAVFSALSHPARRRVLVILHARGGEMTAGEINDRFKHSWPTTTRHLAVLQRAGLVAVEHQGRHRIYTLKRRDLLRAGNWLIDWAAAKNTGRRAWADLSYADMRNATPPAGSGSKKPRTSAKRPAKTSPKRRKKT